MPDPSSANITLYVAIISAASALLGTIGGGVTSFFATYFLKKKEWQQDLILKEIGKREAMFSEFIAEHGRLVLASVGAHEFNPKDFGKLYTLQAQFRIHSSKPVVDLALKLVEQVLQSYHPNPDILALNGQEEEIEPLMTRFSEACREELENLRKNQSSSD